MNCFIGMCLKYSLAPEHTLSQMGTCLGFIGSSAPRKVPTTVTNCTGCYLQPSDSTESHAGLWQGWAWKPLPEPSWLLALFLSQTKIAPCRWRSNPVPLKKTDNEGFQVRPSKVIFPHFLCLIFNPFSHRNGCQIIYTLQTFPPGRTQMNILPILWETRCCVKCTRQHFQFITWWEKGKGICKKQWQLHHQYHDLFECKVSFHLRDLFWEGKFYFKQSACPYPACSALHQRTATRSFM